MKDAVPEMDNWNSRYWGAVLLINFARRGATLTGAAFRGWRNAHASDRPSAGYPGKTNS